jgi:hypothetical protein
MPYCSRLLRRDPETAQALDNAVQEIWWYVECMIATHLPPEYLKIKAFVDFLPLNHLPPTYPFTSFVVNVQACTEGHLNSGDDTICVFIPFGQ